MSELKCQFCQQELEEETFYKGRVFVSCNNPNCWGGIITELIRTRKALDVAISGLEKMTYGCDSSDAEHLLKEIKEITALKQKE